MVDDGPMYLTNPASPATHLDTPDEAKLERLQEVALSSQRLARPPRSPTSDFAQMHERIQNHATDGETPPLSAEAWHHSPASPPNPAKTPYTPGPDSTVCPWVSPHSRHTPGKLLRSPTSSHARMLAPTRNHATRPMENALFPANLPNSPIAPHIPWVAEKACWQGVSHCPPRFAIRVRCGNLNSEHRPELFRMASTSDLWMHSHAPANPPILATQRGTPLPLNEEYRLDAHHFWPSPTIAPCV